MVPCHEGGDPFVGGMHTVYRTYGPGGVRTQFFSTRQPTSQSSVVLFLTSHLQPSLIQRLLPLIMIVGYMVLMFFVNRPSQAPFSINRTPEYSVQRVQPETRLPYYVTPSFDSSDRNVRNVENSVLRYYFQQYEYLCMRDVQREMQVGLRVLGHVQLPKEKRRETGEIELEWRSIVICRSCMKYHTIDGLLSGRN